jgi:DNA-binding NtrC family response regulator
LFDAGRNQIVSASFHLVEEGAMLPTAVVVDDDALLRECTVETVAECGFAVLEAATCDTALSMLEERKGAVAFIVTDVRLPGRLDGMDFARLVAGRWPWIRMLVISGYEDDRASRLPANATFMSRPWRALDFINFVLDARHLG